ncbi:MAG: ankyrin repeat domain-containing protein [Planctomycetota bacterium]
MKRSLGMMAWLVGGVLLVGVGIGKAAADPMHHAIVRGDLPTVKRLVELGYPVNPPAGERLAIAPLAVAASEGDVGVIRFLLESGARTDVIGVRRRSPLMAAARAGQIDAMRVLIEAEALAGETGTDALFGAIVSRQSDAVRLQAVEMLIEAGVDVNAARRGGVTPLMSAVRGQQAGIVKRLLEAGAVLESVDRDGLNVMTVAVRHPDLDTLRVLLEAGGDPMTAGLTPLMAAVVREDGEAAGRLLAGGSDPDALWRLGSEDKGQTALITATALGDEAMVKRLLAAGANPNLGRGWPWDDRPLHRAVRLGHAEIAKMLLEAGADVRARQSDGPTPLFLAAQHGQGAMIPVLLEAGADVADAGDDERDTALHRAAAAGHAEAVRALLVAGAPHDQTDRRARMPIHYAAASGDLATVQALLDAGVDLKSRDLRRLLPNLWDDISAEVIPLLVEHGLDPNAKSMFFRMGRTPLMIVSEQGDPARVAAMLAAGADVGGRDEAGNHALSRAVLFGRPETINPELARLLIEAGAPVNPDPEEYVLPLVTAAGEANYAVVELLLEAGADPNRAAADGTTPLMAAAARKTWPDPYIVRLLLEAGADPEARDKDGNRAIDLMVEQNRPDAEARVRRLLKNPPKPVMQP